jgi:hypothetical protein
MNFEKAVNHGEKQKLLTTESTENTEKGKSKFFVFLRFSLCSPCSPWLKNTFSYMRERFLTTENTEKGKNLFLLCFSPCSPCGRG